MEFIRTISGEEHDLDVHRGQVEVRTGSVADPTEHVEMVVLNVIDNRNPAKATLMQVRLQAKAADKLASALQVDPSAPADPYPDESAPEPKGGSGHDGAITKRDIINALRTLDDDPEWLAQHSGATLNYVNRVLSEDQ